MKVAIFKLPSHAWGFFTFRSIVSRDACFPRRTMSVDSLFFDLFYLIYLRRYVQVDRQQFEYGTKRIIC